MGARKGRLAFIATCILLLIALSALVKQRPPARSRPVVVPPSDQFIAVEVLDDYAHGDAVADRATTHSHPIVVVPDDESIGVEDLGTKDTDGSVADHAATEYHTNDVVALDQFIATKALDERAYDGVGNNYARSISHLVVVAPEDQSTAVKVPDETAPASGSVIVFATPEVSLDKKATGLDETASDGGFAVDTGELARFFDFNLDAHELRKTETFVDGADPTVQVSHEDSTPRAFVDAAASRRSVGDAVADRVSSTHSLPIVVAPTINSSLSRT